MTGVKEPISRFQRGYRIPGLTGQEVVCDLFDAGYGKEKRSAFVFLHGGGFVGGSRDQFFAAASWLSLTEDALCITVDYRTAKAAPYPAPVIDCLSVFRWIWEMREEYRIDPGLVFVVGGSPGANIGGMAMTADREWLHRYGVPCTGIYQPDHAVFLNGIYDISEFYKENEQERERVRAYIGENVPESVFFRETSFQTWGLEGQRWYLLHGSQDEVIALEQCERVKQRAENLGGSVQIHSFDGRGHAWFNEPECLYQVLITVKEILEAVKGEVK